MGLLGNGGAPAGEGGDGGVRELQEMKWRVMARSIWAVGARMRGLRGELPAAATMAEDGAQGARAVQHDA